ncbi:transposable element Tc1 transposase [Trichonephila clavipes]|nr:transposable element Tc1 transposase [Trichonephila clavipes]
MSLDKSDHPCPEAVTGLCRYFHHSASPPVIRWIGEWTTYIGYGERGSLEHNATDFVSNKWVHCSLKMSQKGLTGDSKRVYIWKKNLRTRNDPSNIVERDRFGSGGVMVWGNNDRWTYASTCVQKRICDMPDISG